MIRSPALAAFAALALGPGAPAMAGEYTTFQPLWVTSATMSGRAACGSTALLNLPAGWAAGDAAVVLMTTSPITDPLRDRLVAALLHERAAVLEMVSGGGTRCAIDGAEDSVAATAAEPVADMLGALRALTRDAGAGITVAIGYGAGATLALEAVRDDVAARHLGSDTPRFAAGAALGNGRPGFVLGPVQQAGHQAPARLDLLCAALSQVADGPGDRQPAAAAASCRAAFVQNRAPSSEAAIQSVVQR